MRIVSSNVKGKESVKYYFTQREKDLLRGYIPVNPCLKCPNNISCVGCPSSREYFSKMTQLFGDDPNLIKMAEKVANLRSEKKALDSCILAWKDKVNRLPNQIRDLV